MTDEPDNIGVEPKPEEPEIVRAREIGRRETVAEAWAARSYGPPPGMNISLWMRSQVARELAAEEAALEAAALPDRPARASSARTSTVFSMRLGAEEYAALQERSRRLGVRPSVLARTYIRSALVNGRTGEWTLALDRLDEVAAELRSLLR